MDSTPWSYFQRVYELPIRAHQTAQLNWERFRSPADWNLVQQAGTTPITDTAKLRKPYSQLETDFLQQLPQIPVWYNGAWFQGPPSTRSPTYGQHHQPNNPGTTRPARPAASGNGGPPVFQSCRLVYDVDSGPSPGLSRPSALQPPP